MEQSKKEFENKNQSQIKKNDDLNSESRDFSVSSYIKSLTQPKNVEIQENSSSSKKKNRNRNKKIKLNNESNSSSFFSDFKVDAKRTEDEKNKIDDQMSQNETDISNESSVVNSLQTERDNVEAKRAKLDKKLLFLNNQINHNELDFKAIEQNRQDKTQKEARSDCTLEMLKQKKKLKQKQKNKKHTNQKPSWCHINFKQEYLSWSGATILANLNSDQKDFP